MILFCEECGTKHDVTPDQLKDNTYQFSCNVCQETLMVSLSTKQGKSVQAAMQEDEIQSDTRSDAPLKVLVVDDSKLIRKVLRQIIESDSCKKVVGEAEDGKKAIDVLNEVEPDVITLDINMPVMDGLTTLKHIMIRRPTPTVMISALTKEGALETFDALKYGAIDFLPKPSQVKGADLNTQKDEIIRKIDLAAGVQIESVRYLRRISHGKQKETRSDSCFHYVVAIGAAEGGYGALLNVIPSLRENLPVAYVAVMHQIPRHVDAFAHYLNQCSQLEVRRATQDAILRSGICYLAAAGESVFLEKQGEQINLKLMASDDEDDANAIDKFFASVSDTMESKAAGILLSGAGHDGVDGLGGLIEKGGTSFVQDPLSCLFKETPLAATNKYSVDYIVSDKQMAGALNSFLISQSV